MRAPRNAGPSDLGVARRNPTGPDRPGASHRTQRSAPVSTSVLVLLPSLLACGCAPLGPRTIPRDRFDYVASMNESWKRQALINIVRLRYLEPPSFVDVGQIVSGYSLETGIDGGGQLARSGA